MRQWRPQPIRSLTHGTRWEHVRPERHRLRSGCDALR